jgi:hypothetical protein
MNLSQIADFLAQRLVSLHNANCFPSFPRRIYQRVA